jgi:hypothetical protein
VSLKRLAVACLLAASLMAVGSAPAEPNEEACTWGASSVMIEEVDGQYVQSGPVTTGCIPTGR